MEVSINFSFWLNRRANPWSSSRLPSSHLQVAARPYNWCSCLTVLITPEHHRPLYCSLCSDVLPTHPLRADWWILSWDPRKEQDSSSEKQCRGCPFSLSPECCRSIHHEWPLLHFYLSVVSHGGEGEWTGMLGSRLWYLPAFPLSCERLNPQIPRTVTHSQHGEHISSPSCERHTDHLQQPGCPLGTTAVCISQQTPCVVRICVYLSLNF